MSKTKASNEKKEQPVTGRNRAPMVSYNVNGAYFTPQMERQPDGSWRPCKGFREFLERVRKDTGNLTAQEIESLRQDKKQAHQYLKGKFSDL